MRWSRALFVLAAAALAYLLLWPTPIDPVAWQAPEAPGYVGAFAPNQALATLHRLDLDGFSGPEDLARGADGRIYVSTHEGALLELAPDGRPKRVVTRQLGRALGIEVDVAGRIVVADAFRGLLSVTSSGAVTVLATECEGKPIVYADDVDVSKDGDRIFVSDASTKFSAEQWGGTLPASKLDIFEHGGHGRILEHRRSTGQTRTLLDGLQFANGIALSEDESRLVIAETGMYRLLVLHLTGPKTGQTEVLLDNLPGFPDNVERGRQGRFWVGLVSARSKPVDALSGVPFVRSIVQRLPQSVRPDVVDYGHVFAVTLDGQVQVDLQDPSGDYGKTTGALEAGPYLFITSLSEPELGRLPADPKWGAR